MPSQHSSLSLEKWSGFTLDQQILMIANEMNRAGKRLESASIDGLQNSYERILNLTDLTIQANAKPTLRREILRWRDLIAKLYISAEPDVEAHTFAFKSLLLFTPEASKQRRHLMPRYLAGWPKVGSP